jgi:hypothetical protein
MARGPSRRPAGAAPRTLPIWAALAALLTGSLAAPTGWSQGTTPNWGAKNPSTQAAQSAQAAQPTTTPWGSKGADTTSPSTTSATPNKGANGSSPSKAAVSPSLEALLKRPDADVITAPDGRHTTVGEIRKVVARRRAIIDALRIGKLPPGWKSTSSPPKASPSRAELLKASTTLRDASHAEAQAAIAHGASSSTVRRPTATAAEQAFTSSSLRTRAGREPGGAQNLALTEQIKPGIFLINRKSSGVQITPGGQYAINGLGFGAAMGQVDLAGKHLPGGHVALQVTQWNDGQIIAFLPEPLRGLADQPLTLRVVTPGGTLYTHDVQFYATREEISVDSLQGTLPLDRAFKAQLSNLDKWASGSIAANVVSRSTEGQDIGCPNPGNDVLTITPPSGWALTEASVTSAEPTQSDPKHDIFGADGDTVVTSNWDITGWQSIDTFTSSSAQLTVHWGVFRSHTASGVTTFHLNDYCSSVYSVQARFIGPAGLKPY